MKSLSFVVPGRVQSWQRVQSVPMGMCTSCNRKGRHNQQGCTACGSPMRFLANVPVVQKETLNYQNWVASRAEDAKPQGFVRFGERPIKVTCVFHFEIPQSRIKKLKAGDHHAQRPDVDNCKKNIMDAGNRVLWTDDCIVAEIHARKEWWPVNEALVTVEEL